MAAIFSAFGDFYFPGLEFDFEAFLRKLFWAATPKRAPKSRDLHVRDLAHKPQRPGLMGQVPYAPVSNRFWAQS